MAAELITAGAVHQARQPLDAFTGQLGLRPLNGKRGLLAWAMLAVVLAWCGLAEAGPKIESWQTERGSKVLFVNAYSPTATLAITGPWVA